MTCTIFCELYCVHFYIHVCVFFPSIKLDIENEVNNEMANRMSLFYAEATPMLKTLSTATTNFVTEVLPAVLLLLCFILSLFL